MASTSHAPRGARRALALLLLRASWLAAARRSAEQGPGLDAQNRSALLDSGPAREPEVEIRRLESEVERLRKRLQDAEEQGTHAVARINTWFKQHAGRLLFRWTPDDVLTFFSDNGQPKIANEAAEDKVDGRALFRLFLDCDMNAGRALGFTSKQELLDTKVDLWNYLVTKKTMRGLDEKQKAAKDKCGACDHFEVEHTSGYEWVLWPLTPPWPNPIQTFICNPTNWTEYDPNKAMGTSGSDGKVKQIAKRLGNWMSSLLGSVTAGVVNVMKTMARCGMCGLCIMWEGFKSSLASVGEMMRKARQWITQSASAKEKNAVYNQFADGFKSSLMEAIVGHPGLVDASIPWERLAERELNRTQLYTSEEIEERMEEARRQHELAVKVVQSAEVTSYDRTSRQIRSFWEPQLGRHRRTAAPQAHGAAGSLVQLHGLPDLPKDMEVPNDCLKVMDPQNHPLAFRDAWQIALNIEEPALGEVFTNLVLFQFKAALEALIPEILVMIIPLDPAYGQCFFAAEKLREAEATTCTRRHKGMCHLSMKHRLFTKMVQQEWPPVSPNWRERMSITTSLNRDVLDTCLGEDQVLGTLRQSSKKTGAGRSTSLTAKQQKDNRDYQDCRFINQQVTAMDSTDKGLPRYSSMIWFAAMQVWVAQNQGDDGLVDARLGSEASEPNVDPFIYQFCSSLLDCEPQRAKGPYSWKAFLRSFKASKTSEQASKTSEPAGQEEGEESRATRLWGKVAAAFMRRNRTQMAQHWQASVWIDSVFWAKDDGKAVRSLQATYVQKIKPLMKDVLDLRTDPFAEPSPFVPQRAWVSSTNIEPPFEELMHPTYRKKSEAVLTSLNLKRKKFRYVWIEPQEERGCAELHVVNVCEVECKHCQVTGDPASGSGLRDRTVTECSGGGGLHIFSQKATVISQRLEACGKCLSYHQVARLVDCNSQPEFEFYSMDHPLQSQTKDSQGTNEYAVVHGFWQDLSTQTTTNRVGQWKSPFRRTFIEFADVSGYKRLTLIKAFFATIRNIGRCYCLCETLRDYRERVPCFQAVDPTIRTGDPAASWCLPKDSTIPHAFCCPRNFKTGPGFDVQALLKREAVFQCHPHSSYEAALEACRTSGLELCPASAVRLLSKRLALLDPEGASLAKFGTCVAHPMLGAAGPQDKAKGTASLPALTNDVAATQGGRLWQQFDEIPVRSSGHMDMRKSLTNGEFLFRFATCMQKPKEG